MNIYLSIYKQSFRTVNYSQGLAFASELGIPFIECSSKTGENIGEVYKYTFIYDCRIFIHIRLDINVWMYVHPS
jgi:hypothetical protein